MAKTRSEETVIAHGVRVEGDFASQGDVLIEGEITGNIHTMGDLRVGESSNIAADVVAQNAVVGGAIKGNVHIGGRLELLASARIEGDIAAEVFSVAAGAQVNGRVIMNGSGGKTKKKEGAESEA